MKKVLLLILVLTVSSFVHAEEADCGSIDKLESIQELLKQTSFNFDLANADYHEIYRPIVGNNYENALMNPMREMNRAQRLTEGAKKMVSNNARNF